MQNARRFKLNFSILSVSYILLGLVMILFQAESKLIISILLGVFLVLLGIMRVSFVFIRDELGRVFQNDLATGVLLLAAGVYFIAKAQEIWVWVPAVLGFAIIYDSVIKMQHSFELKRLKFAYWWGVLIAALVTTVLGSLLVIIRFDDGMFFYYAGVVTMLDGVLNLCTLVLSVTRMKKAEKARESGAGGPPPAGKAGKSAKEEKPKKAPVFLRQKDTPAQGADSSLTEGLSPKGGTADAGATGQPAETEAAGPGETGKQ